MGRYVNFYRSGLSVILALTLTLPVLADEVSRQSIQEFFRRDEKNSTLNPDWTTRFLYQRVRWQGKVYKIRDSRQSSRVELLVKVLPDSLLYDTVIVLEGDTRIDPSIAKGSIIDFAGKIFRGIDAFGVKEVQVLVETPGDITFLKDE